MRVWPRARRGVPEHERMDRERIGKYKIVGELGRGTMGEVFKAHDPVLNRHVALKTLTSRAGSGGEALQRFQREAQAAALLSHPNIVTVYDFGDEDGLLYIAMELLEGTDLRDAIDNDRLKTLDEKLDIMDGVLAALDYAHGKGVVHRDVKPANIHLGGKDRQVKIMDFGLARVESSEMTQDGIVLGTPNYMSPEQAIGERVDGRSDLFSAGAVLYELLTGHKPFEADSTPSVLYQVVHKEAPPVRRWAPQTAAPLVAIVERALKKDRQKRFANAAEMRDALASARLAVVGVPALDAATDRSRPPSSPRSDTGPHRSLRGSQERRGVPSGSVHASARSAHATRRRRFRPVLAGLLVIAAGAGVAVWLWLRSPSPLPAGTDGATSQQVGALTQALVATQVQLAARELEDKNYAAAARQAESALRLVRYHPRAERIRTQAREQLAALDDAVRSARDLAEIGEMEAASQQLSRVLELDPRHPAAGELTARLNSAFRAQAEEAAAAMRASRDAAARAGATTLAEFRAANEGARTAQAFVEREEFAEATRAFLEARDGFDRAGRAVHASHSPAGPSATAPAAGRPTPAPRAAAVTAAPEPGRPPAAASPTTAAAASASRSFLAEDTVVATASAGKPRGFDSRDVSTLRTPQFTGRIRFEVVPATVRTGDAFLVRAYVVNEGRRALRIRSLSLEMIVNGERSPVTARALHNEVGAQNTTLLAEHSGVWNDASSWALELVVTSDRNETISAALRSH